MFELSNPTRPYFSPVGGKTKHKKKMGSRISKPEPAKESPTLPVQEKQEEKVEKEEKVLNLDSCIQRLLEQKEIKKSQNLLLETI